MRRISQGYYLLLWMGIGIVVATLAANRLFSSGLVNYQVLYQNMVAGWQHGAEAGRTDIWTVLRILAVRMMETAAIAFVCRSAFRRGRRIGITLLLAYTGAVTGVCMVLMTWCRGLLGIFSCFAACMPHYLFYLMAWGMLILQALSGYEIRRGRFWTAFGLLFAAGILSEIFINPFFLRWV